MEAALKTWEALAMKYNDTDQWKGACVARINNEGVLAGNSSNVFAGLVSRYGEPVNISIEPNNVWGIDLDVCKTYCGWDKLQTIFSFEIFSSGATNYLLPWLALTAQLPFETGEQNVNANFMSFCMALGSPMLITFSLMITILNQHWLRTHFRDLESHAPIRDTVKNARMFLQESQQVPLRLSQDDGSLGSLIVLAENKVWWEQLRESVQRTRRGVTLSLIAQIVVAIMSWVLTVISAFMSSLGSPTEALILSGGSLWVWLVPVICGWITVGTQNDHSTIKLALNRDEAAIAWSSLVPSGVSTGAQARHFSNATSRTLGAEPNDQDAISAVSGTSEKAGVEEVDPMMGMTKFWKSEQQKGFRIAYRYKMQPLARQPMEDGKVRLDEAQHMPGCFGFNIAGYEKQEGPTFNYARMFTWWHLANQIHDTFERTTQNLKLRKDLNGIERPEYENFQHEELRGDTLSVLQYCGLATKSGRGIVELKDLTEYPAWHQLDAAFWQRSVIAMIMAVFVQWGSTGAALVTGYLTEVVGLGCRSGSYLIYGSLGTISCILLLASSFLSNAAMLQHQSLHLANRKTAESRTPAYSFPSSLTWCRIAAVATRLSGRLLVVSNAIWLILISFWELVGFFNNCWCDSVTLSRGSKGFIILFKDAQEMAPAAMPAWAGGVFLSISVMSVSSAVFWLFCRGNRK